MDVAAEDESDPAPLFEYAPHGDGAHVPTKSGRIIEQTARWRVADENHRSTMPTNATPQMASGIPFMVQWTSKAKWRKALNAWRTLEADKAYAPHVNWATRQVEDLRPSVPSDGVATVGVAADCEDADRQTSCERAQPVAPATSRTLVEPVAGEDKNVGRKEPHSVIEQFDIVAMQVRDREDRYLGPTGGEPDRDRILRQSSNPRGCA